mmetsp:Transcript_3423/g.10390  ORF Transcript_3423/g.10390 Transcript_3423/m.10390 type:complete len:387 (-) Transcript_3423:725-1885(-)
MACRARDGMEELMVISPRYVNLSQSSQQLARDLISPSGEGHSELSFIISDDPQHLEVGSRNRTNSSSWLSRKLSRVIPNNAKVQRRESSSDLTFECAEEGLPTEIGGSRLEENFSAVEHSGGLEKGVPERQIELDNEAFSRHKAESLVETAAVEKLYVCHENSNDIRLSRNTTAASLGKDERGDEDEFAVFERESNVRSHMNKGFSFGVLARNKFSEDLNTNEFRRHRSNYVRGPPPKDHQPSAPGSGSTPRSLSFAQGETRRQRSCKLLSVQMKKCFCEPFGDSLCVECSSEAAYSDFRFRSPENKSLIVTSPTGRERESPRPLKNPLCEALKRSKPEIEIMPIIDEELEDQFDGDLERTKSETIQDGRAVTFNVPSSLDTRRRE